MSDQISASTERPHALDGLRAINDRIQSLSAYSQAFSCSGD